MWSDVALGTGGPNGQMEKAMDTRDVKGSMVGNKWILVTPTPNVFEAFAGISREVLGDLPT